MSNSRVTFGIIVLNGEPFTRYALRALYPFAYQIVVVEGAAPGARNIATPNGHSRDGTLDNLRKFKVREDPENKVSIVTAEDEGHPNGFWPGEKDEQSRAYAKRAKGDWLWQVDIDEFYRGQDMRRVLQMLRDEPDIAGMTFKQITFWGGLDYLVDGWYLQRGATYYHRLFKWGPGYTYVTHRPPTVTDANGQDLRRLKWIDGETLSGLGIHLYHYSLLLPKQVMEKCDYYANAQWARRNAAVQWAQDTYLKLKRPFRVHNVYDYPSWLHRYTGSHPDIILAMMKDLRENPSEIALRSNADIDQLLGAWWYRCGRALLEFLEPLDRRIRDVARRIKRLHH